MNALRCHIFESFFVHLFFYSQSSIAPKANAVFLYVTLMIDRQVVTHVAITVDAVNADYFAVRIHATKNTKATILFYLETQVKANLNNMNVIMYTEQYAQLQYQFAIYDSKLIKKEIIARPVGNRSNIEVVGKYIATPHTRLSCNTYQYHEHPDTQSNVIVEGISTEQSSVTHQGFIFIAPRAVGTQTKQSSKHMTLSKTVHVHAEPILDVQNNTVSCSHASAIGTINQEMIFYMNARGVSVQDATFFMAQSYALLKPTNQIEHALHCKAKRILRASLGQL